MRYSILALALAMVWSAAGCIESPANGDFIRESASVPFSGYAQKDAIALQAEVVNYQTEPGCVVDPCAVEICTPRGVCRCRPSVCPRKAVASWQTFATTQADISKPAQLFADQTYDLFFWSTHAQIPAAGWRTITGRDGSTFRGARVRAVVRVMNSEVPFYTVKQDAVACWNANHGTFSSWESACTPGSENKVLELRSAGY